jgi:HEAT repeat protein
MDRSFAGHQADARALRIRISRLFQIRLSRLMVLVAISAVLLSAWLFNREYSNSQHAWTNSQIVALSERDATRRREAAENLHNVERDDLARTVSVLAGALTDPDWQVRHAAAQSLAAAIGSSGGITNSSLIDDINLAARALIPVCDDSHDKVRLRAIQSLGRLFDSPPLPRSGRKAPPASRPTVAEARRGAGTLSRAMRDPSPQLRAQAVWSFARVGRICGEVADPVKAMAENDPDRKVRIAALDALGVGWPEDTLFVSVLLQRLKIVSDCDERAHIGWVIGRLGPAPVETLPALVDALSADDWVLRSVIPYALGKLGGSARPALPALARMARVELADHGPQCPAIEAIRSIAPDSPEATALIESLAVLLRDSAAESQREKATFQLARFGPSAVKAVGQLRDTLKSPKPDVKERAIFVLGYMGPPAASAIADLETIFRDDPESNARRFAQGALRMIKALAPINPDAQPWPSFRH